MNLFIFFTDLKNFCDDFCPVILNLAYLLALVPSSVDISKTSNISTNSEILSNESPNLWSSNKVKESSNKRFLERERERSSLTVQQYIITDMRANLLVLMYLAVISLGMKFLFFQKDSNFSLLLNK